VFEGQRRLLQRQWAETSYQIQRLRDNADCAEQEFDVLLEEDNPGLSVKLSFDVNQDIAAPYIKKGIRPQVAVLREQGVNGQVEMAAAFDRAGFNAIDVHMSDILAGRVDLNEFKGLVACGGFSYGDVLGAGEGWAKSALFNSRARDAFQGFFERNDSFTLGVCNGCQMMSNLHELIPGSEFWPHFVRNRSEQFEARGDGAGAGVELDLPAGHGRFAHADRHRPRRRPCRVRQRRSAAGSRSVRLRGHAFRRQPRQGHRSLPGQPERLAARDHRPDQPRRSRDHHDAAPGARVPRRAELVALGRLERRRPWMRMFRNARVWVN
jgi:phosphoribosylformylglycinamidine synthase